MDNIIEKAIKDWRKGYVCVVDGNVLAHATKNPSYLNIVNEALANSCDGSSISILAGFIHKQNYKTYINLSLRNQLKKYLQNTIFQ